MPRYRVEFTSGSLNQEEVDAADPAGAIYLFLQHRYEISGLLEDYDNGNDPHHAYHGENGPTWQRICVSVVLVPLECIDCGNEDVEDYDQLCKGCAEDANQRTLARG